MKVNKGRERKSSQTLILTRFLLVLVVLFSNAFIKIREAEAAITLVGNIGTNNQKDGGHTSLSVTVGASGVGAGHSIIVTIAMDNSPTGAVSCSDTAGNTYTNDVDFGQDSGTNGSRTIICAAHNVSALVNGNTITVNHPNVKASAMSANEFSGLATSSVLDKTASAGDNTGTNTSPTSGNTATTTQANELLIGAIAVEGPTADTFTLGASYSTLTRAGTNAGSAQDNITMNCEYQIVSATGAYHADGTMGTARNSWAAAIATYKAAASLVLVKQVWQVGGSSPLALTNGSPTSTNVPIGTTLVFLIYVKNTQSSAETDVRFSDALDVSASGFTYVAGSLIRTSAATPPADTASDLTIFNATASGTGTALTDALTNADVAAFVSPNLTVGGDGTASQNATLSIAAHTTFAIRLQVTKN